MRAPWTEVQDETCDLDAILPDQYHTPAVVHTGERGILWGILKRSFQDYWLEDQMEAAAKWFASDETGYGSFVYVCNELDLSPSKIRGRLMDLTIEEANAFEM